MLSISNHRLCRLASTPCSAMSVSFASGPSSSGSKATAIGATAAAANANATATAAVFTDGVLAAVGRHTADALQTYIIGEQDFVGSLGPAVAELFRLEQLPDNPYPFLLERLRAIELKQALTHAHPSNAIPAAPAENDLAAPDAKNQVCRFDFDACTCQGICMHCNPIMIGDHFSFDVIFPFSNNDCRFLSR